jgi:hypothetical protein
MQRIKTTVKIFKNPQIQKIFCASVINVESENKFTTLLFIMQYVMLFFVLNGSSKYQSANQHTMQKQSYNTGPQCKRSKNQNTQTHKLKNCSYNCNNTFKLINNFRTIIKFESLLVDCCFESIGTPKHLSQTSWSQTKYYWLPSYVDQFLLFIFDSNKRTPTTLLMRTSPRFPCLPPLF